MRTRSAHDGRTRRHVGLRSLTLVAAAATLVSGSALAATIVGTAKDDTIRGTAKADKLYGRLGNDRLYGLAGDDYLNGGAGRDRFFCGPGKDTVVADGGEAVGRDCEVVRRIGRRRDAASGRAARTRAASAPLPRPPPPPAPPAKAGFFGGFASTGGSVNFVVAADGRSFSQFKFGYEADCQPPGQAQWRRSRTPARSRSRPTARLGGRDDLGRYDREVQRLLRRGRNLGVRALPGPRDARRGRDHYDCDSGGADWSAKWQG